MSILWLFFLIHCLSTAGSSPLTDGNLFGPEADSVNGLDASPYAFDDITNMDLGDSELEDPSWTNDQASFLVSNSNDFTTAMDSTQSDCSGIFSLAPIKERLRARVPTTCDNPDALQSTEEESTADLTLPVAPALTTEEEVKNYWCSLSGMVADFGNIPVCSRAKHDGIRSEWFLNLKPFPPSNEASVGLDSPPLVQLPESGFQQLLLSSLSRFMLRFVGKQMQRGFKGLHHPFTFQRWRAVEASAM